MHRCTYCTYCMYVCTHSRTDTHTQTHARFSYTVAHTEHERTSTASLSFGHRTVHTPAKSAPTRWMNEQVAVLLALVAREKESRVVARCGAQCQQRIRHPAGSRHTLQWPRRFWHKRCWPARLGEYPVRAARGAALGRNRGPSRSSGYRYTWQRSAAWQPPEDAVVVAAVSAQPVHAALVNGRLSAVEG